MVPDITLDTIYTALYDFMVQVLPDGIEIVRGAQNRVAEPGDDNFVVMTLIYQDRLATNRETDQDCVFTASITSDTMVVTEVDHGTINVGAVIFAPGVTTSTIVKSSNGGVEYTVSPSQTVTSRKMAAGQLKITQPVRFHFQLDIHGTSSADNAVTLSTALRSQYAVDSFPSAITPLWSDDPKYLPFINDQQQYEFRWIVEAHFQADPSLFVPQQYADAVTTTLIKA